MVYSGCFSNVYIFGLLQLYIISDYKISIIKYFLCFKIKRTFLKLNSVFIASRTIPLTTQFRAVTETTEARDCRYFESRVRVYEPPFFIVSSC